ADLRPRLTVSYACECGADCTAADEEESTFCEANFVPVNRVLNFKWAADDNYLTGIDFLKEGTVTNGVTVPTGGAWAIVDGGDKRVIVNDVGGLRLTGFDIAASRPRGIAFIASGTWAGHLAVADEGDDAILIFDLDGNIVTTLLVELISKKPYGLSFIGTTDSGVYDNHLVFASSDNNGDLYIVDQSGVLKKNIHVESYAPDIQGVAHLPGADKFLLLDKTGVLSVIDFDGALLNQYNTETWGFSETQGLTVHPTLCHHVLASKNASRVSGFNIEGYQGGFGRLLMVVGDASSLTAEEQAKRTLFESWNFLVTLIADHASTALYDIAAGAHDVAFVDQNIAASQLRDRLENAPLGVVNEEANLSDEFGLSASIGWSSTASFDVVDNDHFITRPFATGPFGLLVAADDVAYLAGTQAPDLRTLGSTGAGPMLVALEASGTRHDALPSAGRRVQLPWGGSNFQLSNLRPDGREVLHRALRWGLQPARRCNADFAANTLTADFAWMPGTGDIQGIDYVPGAVVINGVAVPPTGGWIMNDPKKKRLFVTDMDGNPLTDFSLQPEDTRGVTYIDSGQWIHYVAVAEKNLRRIYYLDRDGEIAWSFKLNPITPGVPLGLGFIGSTISGDYDNHLALASDKNASGDGDATIFVVDQDGATQHAIDIEAIAPKVQGVTHLPGTDSLLIADEDGVVSVINFEGTLLRQYVSVPLGVEKINNIAINPWNCDHLLVDDTRATVTGVNRTPPGSGPEYVEMYLPWLASSANTWQTINLGIYGVPPNAVVEVAVINHDGGKEWWGGVRAVGSALQRRIQIHEADGGGMDVITMHVQADADGRIEHYTDDIDKVSFQLLGYWTHSAYTENMQAFKAGVSGSWQTRTLSGWGVSANNVAEILAVNNAGFNEREVGMRSRGSSLSRIFDLHEAKDGGSEQVSTFVAADNNPGARIEVYTEDDSDVDFYLLGHWSTPPGVFTEAFADLGKPTVEKVWQIKDLGPYGVPQDAVAQVAAVNRQFAGKALLGLRFPGSYFERTLQLHEPDNGGQDYAPLHVTTNGDAEIEWFQEDTDKDHRFYLLGWWAL
ncbi:MAG: hypothetical protein WBN34_15460, partial [Woeseia sp.]